MPIFAALLLLSPPFSCGERKNNKINLLTLLDFAFGDERPPVSPLSPLFPNYLFQTPASWDLPLTPIIRLVQDRHFGITKILLKTSHLSAVALAALLLNSCAGDNDYPFTAYSGAQQKWPYTSGAFVSMVRGMPVYEGLPNRPYTVIGKLLVDQGGDSIVDKSVVKEAKRYGADGLLVVSSKTFNDGTVNMGNLMGTAYPSGFSASGLGVTVVRRHQEADVWLIKFQ